MVIARRIRYGMTQEQHRPNVETLEKLGQAFGERFVRTGQVSAS